MKCFRCGSTLNPKSQVCTRCGQDVRLYKKIIKTGNAYYNLGLTKAQIRDLSGAVIALRKCLEFNKRHIEARNLLGLVYYEMGETVLALREWIISRNYRAQNNPADRYIKDLQASQNQFEAMMQGIQKYNLSLKYAQTDGPDLAIIQLKKVLTTNPNLIRAQLLLALLYMQERSYGKAQRLLNKVLSIDKGNTTARRYLNEMRELEHRAPEQVKPEDKNRQRLGRAEVIIPSYATALSSYFMTALYVVIGLVIGVLALYFLVVPSKEQQYADRFQQQVSSLQTEISSRDADIAHLKGQLDTLEEDKKELQDELDTLNADGEAAEDSHLSVRQAYDACLEMLQYYIQGDYASVATYAPQLAEDTLDSDAYRSVYQLILVDNRQMMFDTCMAAAEQTFNAGNYAQAAVYYESAMDLDSESSKAIFWCGVSYHHLGERDKANELYDRVINEFPTSEEAPQALVQRNAP